MAKLFKLKVSSPAGILFEDEVLQVEIKTKTGYMALLADHTPIISSFLPSICYIRDLKNNRVSSIINEVSSLLYVKTPDSLFSEPVLNFRSSFNKYGSVITS